MTRIASPSPRTITAVAATSLALAVGLTACVSTVSGPLPQAGGGQALAPSSGGGGDAATSYGGGSYGGGSYGGLALGFGGASYGGASYGGASYGGASYGGASYGGGSDGGGAPSVGIYGCRVDADCTVYFRTQSCFPADPLGVATAKLAEARRLLPVRRDACGMGGPDYERRRMENEGRYSARCDRQRCAVVDRGPRRTPF